jgi:ribosomal protein L6P/L9E
MKNRVVINIFEKSIKIWRRSNFYLIHVNNESNSFKLVSERGGYIHYDTTTQHIIFYYKDLNTYCNLISKLLNNFLFNFKRLWHVKIKFTGKGFKIKRKKKKKSIKFYFYYSHVNVIMLRCSKLRHRKKNRMIIKTWNKNNIGVTLRKILKIKKLNIFTKRGLRCSKQIIFKKTGKKSNY